MGLLHFHFSFFLGCPDGFREQFSVILVTLWDPLGVLLGLSWRHLGSILAPTSPSWLHLGALLGLSSHVFEPNFDNLDVQIKKIGTRSCEPET